MNAGEVRGRLWRVFMAFAGLLAVSGICPAQVPIPGYPDTVMGFDLREVALLPRYCIYTQSFRDAVPGGNDPPAIKAWYDRLGRTFHDMHHWCYALMKTNRAVLLARDSHARSFYLHDSITEIDYVIRGAPHDFVLLPEMITKKAENLLLLDRAPQAVSEFERAIQLNGDYWPPYAYLSDYYKQLGQRKKARELLETALSRVPDAKGLQRRLAEVDSGPSRQSKR